MKKKMQSGNKGFTLIEVMLSIAILALISIPLLKYFSDSLRYAVITERKQKATLTAQETLEFIKGQDQLMKYQGKLNAAGETVMHYDINDSLKNYFQVWASPAPYPSYEELTAAQTAYDADDGKGTLTYVYSTAQESYPKGFDVKVTLTTNTGASEVSRPVEYGIDDRTNVVAAEFSEEEDAIAYFVAMNTAAYIQRMGGYVVGVTPAPEASGLDLYTVAPDDPEETTVPAGPTSHPYDTVDLLTEDEIKALMKRDIIVKISRADALLEEGVSTFFTVNVTYVYTCPNIENTDPLTPSEFVSNPLVDTNVETLDGIYLMFNKLTESDDTISFEFEDDSAMGAMDASSYPDIRLICQDILIEETEEEGEGGGGGAPALGYTLTTNFTGFTGWSKLPDAKTNLVSPDTIVVGDCDCPSRVLTLDPLTDSHNPVRIFKISVAVYEKGKAESGDAPLVEMVTSKTE